MNKIPNRQIICQSLMEQARTDRDIVVLCSDSRGSASLTPFAEAFPEQFIEVGIAEQDLVGISAGLARCGKKVYCASPASFLSTRSYEQIKVDCVYSDANVKLIGISGGISYGALGMSHHSAQDIAAISAIPGMRVYIPSDRHLTKCLMEALFQDQKPAYIRVGRNAVEDVYENGALDFQMDRAAVIPGDTSKRDAADILIVACGEMVRPAADAAGLLEQAGIKAVVLDMYCVKPLDRETVLSYASGAKAVVTVEEHSPFGGLGAAVSQLVGSRCPRRTVNLALPDEPVISGTSGEVFDYYGLNAEGIARAAKEALK